MEFETLIVKKEGYITTITLNRPDKLNAVDDTMLRELPEALSEVSKDVEARVLIITGAGKAFAAGGSADHIERMRSLTAYEIRNEVCIGQKTIRGIRALNIPTIAMVNGIALGIAFDMALACDIRIGSEKAKFHIGFTRVGLIPGTGGNWLLPRVVGLPKAAEIIFSNRFVEADEAEKIGLLNQLVPAAELESATMKMADQISKAPPVAIKLDKMMLYQGLECDLETAFNLASTCQSMTMTSLDHQEAFAAVMEKREAVFQGK